MFQWRLPNGNMNWKWQLSSLYTTSYLNTNYGEMFLEYIPLYLVFFPLWDKGHLAKAHATCLMHFMDKNKHLFSEWIVEMKRATYTWVNMVRIILHKYNNQKSKIILNYLHNKGRVCLKV
jgi:hypothetical protein